jgi:SAM-dependent methyltransferase
VYKDIDGWRIPREEKLRVSTSIEPILNGFGSDTYGEISVEHVPNLIKLLNIGKDDIFYDLGSGVGKTVLLVALLTDCKRSIGIELSKTRYKASMNALHSLKSESSLRKKGNEKLNGCISKIRFLNKNILDVNLKDATAIYWNNVCFPADVSDGLLEGLKKLNRGSRLLTFKKICCRHNIQCLLKDKPCCYFTLTQEATVSTTWTDNCSALIYTRL